jgi:hypothetical protein
MPVTMKRFVLALVMGVGLVVTADGCGSDGGGLGGSAEATMASCNAYCTAYVAKNCADPMYTSFADCTTKDCGVIQAIPDRCQAKMQAYYDCRKGQTDLCEDSGCSSQLTAAGVCM